MRFQLAPIGAGGVRITGNGSLTFSLQMVNHSSTK